MDMQLVVASVQIVATALMAYIAYSVRTGRESSNEIVILKTAVSNIEKLLGTISGDLKGIAKHDALIAVLNSETANNKADISFLFEKLRELERGDNHPIHRR